MTDILAALGRYGEALLRFSRTLALTLDADVWYNRGKVC